MLTYMIANRQHALATDTGGAAGAADYVVTSIADWNTVFANSAATLAGKIVEVVAPLTQSVAIADRDFAAAGAPVIIRSRDANGSLARLDLYGLVRGINFSGLHFQMTGWPHNWNACVGFGTGTFGALRFLNGTSFRHGYGPSLTDIDTAADLPEYTRVDNVQTATTTSSTYAIPWQDSAMEKGQIEFFNRGTETVYAAVGGSGVTASASDIECSPGQRTRLPNLDPTTDTHIAIIAASGTSEINARAEIGLVQYLADAFQSSGSAVFEDIEIRNCLFRDLTNGVKGLGNPTRVVVMDNDFDRIYGDVVAVTPAVGGEAYILRNVASVQFARSGLPEDRNGDAGDPHGDVYQAFSDGSGTLGDIYVAGNRMRVGPLREGATNQGNLISDNDIDPSYRDVFIISETYVGGSINQIASGEPLYPIEDFLIYGVTIVDWNDVNNVSPRVNLTTDNGGSIYVGSVIAPNFIAPGAEDYMQDGNLKLTEAASPAAVFPNLADLQTATNRAQIEAALTPAAEGAGIGAVATANAINWTASDPSQVIRWENVPSGAHWNDLTNEAASTVIELPLRKVLNRQTGQTVSAGAGTEWRSVDTDGTTELQAWTTSSGTIEPGQFIQIRRSSGAGGTTVEASVTINGIEQRVSIQAASVPTTWLVQGATAGYFADPSNVPAGTNRITFRGTFWFPSAGSWSGKPFAQLSTGCDLEVFSSGAVRITVEDDTYAKVLQNHTLSSGTMPQDQWVDVVFDVDMGTDTATLTLNEVDTVVPFASASSGAFQSVTPVSFMAISNGSSPLPENTRAADLSVDFNGVQHKAIPNDAATANADPWHQGGDLAGSS